MRGTLSGALSALVLSFTMCVASAQAQTSEPTPSASPPQLDMKATQPMVVTPPQTSNPAKEDQTNADASAFSGLAMSDLYNQDVYDARDQKIGAVKDALFDQAGKLNSVILGVGGLLGLGEKNVGVPFTAIQAKVKDGKRYLVTGLTREALEAAPTYTYDRNSGQWVVASKT
jgi:sporulation protein YlmC with PRC-barrel domain